MCGGKPRLDHSQRFDPIIGFLSYSQHEKGPVQRVWPMASVFAFFKRHPTQSNAISAGGNALNGLVKIFADTGVWLGTPR